ncbi:MAG TPA: nucleotide exchange factor GrpE [Burkholderiales bacterium]|nr:nucleotide exchange factor GrpE [Burkholderiales bacterium]
MQEQDFNRSNSAPERMAENNQTPETKPEPGAARADEAAPNLQEQLRKAELEAEEHRDAWLRAKAEAENTRKRAQTDVANAHKYAIENFATELLAIKDSLEATLSAESASLESLKEGVELTLKQLGSVFEKFKLSEIHPVGEKFDPHKHQAITTVESEQPANTVVHVLQKGYQLHDRVIRPALVTVATAKPST